MATGSSRRSARARATTKTAAGSSMCRHMSAKIPRAIAAASGTAYGTVIQAGNITKPLNDGEQGASVVAGKAVGTVELDAEEVQELVAGLYRLPGPVVNQAQKIVGAK